MRMILLPAALVALLLTSGAPAQAQPRDYPWCAWYDWETYNCGFVTLQQCLATVSGAGGICRRNVWSFYEEPRRAPRRRR
jgi:hypothetical protein